MTDDHEQLSYVLQNFQQRDPELLELLNFTGLEVTPDPETGEKLCLPKSALGRAIAESNYKNVLLILKYMSLSSRQNMCHFSHLFHELLDYQSFQALLTHLLFQTKCMEQK